jgi:hypothetical protein
MGFNLNLPGMFHMTEAMIGLAGVLLFSASALCMDIRFAGFPFAEQ